MAMERTPNMRPFADTMRANPCSEKMTIAFLTDNKCIGNGAADSPSGNGALAHNGYGSKSQLYAIGPLNGFRPIHSISDHACQGALQETPYPFPVDDETLGGASQKQRATRVVYTEEQKFFIVYARVVQEQSWSDIEEKFAEIFDHRSKDGITSIYYRVRKNWGLKDIRKMSGPESCEEDRDVVFEKATYFSKDFLLSVGYLT